MWHFQPMAEAAMLAECGIDDMAIANRHAVALAGRLAAVNGISATLGISSVVVRFDPMQYAHNDVTRLLHEASESITLQDEGDARIVDMLVRYGGEDGPDLIDVAKSLEINACDVVALHTSQPWRVLLIGFAPGFPYIGPLPAAMRLPRRNTPRAAVPAGSVAIAAGMTGIYPSRLPGGWHLIGRADVELFNANHEPPALLTAGDFIQFIATHVEGD